MKARSGAAATFLADRIQPDKEPRIYDRTEVYGAVVNKDSKNLEAFNAAIKSMVDDGTRDKLYKQYFAEQAAVPEIPI
jgi:ABC-type amino acid transport substrate-binding protein